MTTPSPSESFDAYQERALSERCECLHQKRQHVADADFDGETWVGYSGRCAVPNCPCRDFTEMEESE